MDHEHIVIELLENMMIMGAFSFTLHNLKTGEEVKVDELVDLEYDKKSNTVNIFYGTKTPPNPSKIKRNKIGEYRFGLEDINYLYFNYKGQRFRSTDLGLIEKYVCASGDARGREEVSEIYLSDKFIGEPIIKLTMKQAF